MSRRTQRERDVETISEHLRRAQVELLQAEYLLLEQPDKSAIDLAMHVRDLGGAVRRYRKYELPELLSPSPELPQEPRP